MKRSFFSFLFFGLFLTALISFADPQDSNNRQGRRNNTKMQKDTSSTRRIEHNTNRPVLDKTDSIPMPAPNPAPIPRPDTMNKGMR